MKSKHKVLLALAINKQYFIRGVVRCAREHDWYLVTDMIYIRRVARGLYDVPKQHPIVGTTTPHIDEVAKAVAGKGSLRVVPPEHRLKALREDYAKIQQMFFGQPLTFDDILAVLHQWETDFNHQ
jgi:hypothetical protein